MSLNSTPSGDRIQIGFFGRRNAGKSSLVNAVTNQQLAVVSDTLGTTTDPVIKAMEILPLGPLVIIDTPGYDDEGALGDLRVKKTKEILRRVDIAILVCDINEGITEHEKELAEIFAQKKIPYILVFNKADMVFGHETGIRKALGAADAEDKFSAAAQVHLPMPADILKVSSETREGINELKEAIGHLFGDKKEFPLVEDLVEKGDIFVLVIPIDSSAPKGRVILPQQQVLRGILDKEGIAISVQPDELPGTINLLGDKIKAVITDSQAFYIVKDMVPDNIHLTSFSILMARRRGVLTESVKGASAIDNLKDGDKVLLSEGCTHHRQCEDIGTVKLPNLLRKYTGKNLEIENSSGIVFADDLSKYALVIHCGGCMLNDKEMIGRMNESVSAGVPITNYGIAISYMRGILDRAVEIIPEIDM